VDLLAYRLVFQVQPHVVGIFAIVVIVARLHIRHFEPILLIQILRRDIAHAHFQYDVIGIERDRAAHHTRQHNFAVALATRIRMRGNRADVRLACDMPQPPVSDNAPGRRCRAQVAQNSPETGGRFFFRGVFQHRHITVG
jgi:hypothetical protein